MGVGSSSFFEAYLVAGFIRPVPSERTASSSLAFELTLVAVPAGRFGFGLSPPFKLDLGRPTPVLVALVRAACSDEAARITWQTSEKTSARFLVEKSGDGVQWAVLTTTMPDANGILQLTDNEVSPGRRYGYRLTGDVFDGSLGEVWLDIPAFVLSLTGAVPNPARSRPFLVRFMLPDGSPARLELLDVAGRRISSREVGRLGAGQHSLDLAERGRVPAGVCFIRLITQSRVLVRKASIVD